MSELVKSLVKKKTVTVRKATVRKKADETVDTTPLRMGEHVFVLEQERVFGENIELTAARTGKMPGLITNVGIRGTNVQFDYSATKGAGYVRTFAVSSNNLRRLRPSELALFQKAKKDATKKEMEKIQKVLTEKMGTKRIPIVDRRDYEIGGKPFLNSNMNFLHFCNLTKQGDEYKLGTLNPSYGAVCCSVTKTTTSIVVNIPKDWLNYYGYNLIDLKAWLKFVNGCEIGCNAYYKEKITLQEAFKSTVIPINMPQYPNNNTVLYPDMEVYQIVIPTSSDRMINYMQFITIRYMYNLQYFTLPFVAMQIKKALGDRITNWEAMLVAHMNINYYGYYNWVSNTPGVYAIPNRTNTPANVLTNIRRSGASMNGSFIYSNPAGANTIPALIRRQDYEGILAFVVAWRTLS